MTEQNNKNHRYNFDELSYKETGDPTLLSKAPLVSVNIVTFNQESFIAQAIEGVLVQQTDFPFEIVIGEDCSSDSTRNIVFDYQEKHPDIIKVITSDRNVGAVDNWCRVNKSCRGKYVAICEGDDYWTDSRKLQEQVDFLEANVDCSAVFHAAEFSFEDNPQKNFIKRPGKKIPNQRYLTKDVILNIARNYTTSSLLCRSAHVKDLPEFFSRAPVGDVPLMLILAVEGDIGYIDEPMCVYRVATGNSWTRSRRNDLEKRRKHYSDTLRMYSEFNSWTENKYWFHVWLIKIKFSTKTNWAELRSFIKRSILGLGKR